MQSRNIIPILFFIIAVIGPATATPSVQVSDIIGNPIRYRDVRVKLEGQVIKVESDPSAPNRVIYTLQDSTDQVIRVKTLVPPELDSYVYLVGTVIQENPASKPLIIEIKHTADRLSLSILFAAGGLLLLAAIVLLYFVLFPKPTAKKRKNAQKEEKNEPVIERKPVITQVFHDDPTAILVAMGGPYKGEIFKLYKGINTIGRDDNQTIQLADDLTISRNHARINANDETIILINESSTNPTKVAGEDVCEKELSDGDIIQIGSTKLRITVISN
jgi:hypothetical protein